jgi:DNA mismatch endonuclease (patch repair protein)
MLAPRWPRQITEAPSLTTTSVATAPAFFSCSDVRYRLHAKGLPGRPDLVLPKYGAVVFVHGCFWHRHPGCRYTSIPSTRPEFWQTKFEANVARDNAARGALLMAGWRVATVWGCAARKPQQVEVAVNLLAAWLRNGSTEIEIGETELVAERAEG